MKKQKQFLSTLCEDLSCHEEVINMDDIDHLLKETDELSDFITKITETCTDNFLNKL